MLNRFFITGIYFAFLTIGICPLNSIAMQADQVVAYNGLQLKGQLNDGSPFEVRISVTPYTSAVKLERFWGIDSDKPEYVIGELSLIINGNEIIVPKKVISDLADVILPCGVYLMQSMKTISLYLKGGDAAGAYTARLIIKNDKILSRSIEFVNSNGELDFEVTNY